MSHFFFRGEIKDLFEKVTKEELEKSILSGDLQKQDQMRYLIQALPFHTDEIDALEQLALKAATTVAPHIEPEIPAELKKLLKEYGLLDTEGNPIELAPLPVSPDADSPSSLLKDNSNDNPLSLDDIQEEVRKASPVKAKDYESFKPIDNGKQNVTSNMESFLKQFGLVDSEDTRKKKSHKGTKSPSNNSDIPLIDSAYLIPGYSSLLDNIGITTTKEKSGKKVSAKTNANAFKADHKNNKAGDDDYKKLEQLLDTIRELEKLNASLTDQEVDRLNLKNFNFSESLLSEGPDPVNYHIQYSALKNEVKRQEPKDEPTRVSLALTGPLLESSLEATDDEKSEKSSTSTSATTTTEKSTTTVTSTTTEDAPSSTTEEERKNSLEDEIEPIDDPEPLPPPRRSGFYMLFDWNSFLEVGEDPEKVVIRFDPKIGDPSRFLPINVP